VDRLRSAWIVLEEWVEINRRPILTISAVVAGLALLFGTLYYFFQYRTDQALNAFAAAHEKFTATVTTGDAAAVPADPDAVTYPDEASKYNDAAAAFEKLASDYSSYREVGRYYAGVSYLHTDVDKGVKLLEEVASGDSEARNQARLALAEHHAKQGAFDKAEAVYEQLVAEPQAMPLQYLKTRLGWVEEKLGKPEEAAKSYREAVDMDRNSPVGVEAEKGLQRVDPKQAASLPPKAIPGSTPGMPPGMMPPGMMPPGGMPGGMPGGAGQLPF
jgi:tetratricopeptide (TPR) repeat protein